MSCTIYRHIASIKNFTIIVSLMSESRFVVCACNEKIYLQWHFHVYIKLYLGLLYLGLFGTPDVTEKII